MSNSLHKTIIEQFAEAVSGHQTNQLDSFLEEAQDYYGRENSTQWKILEFIQDDPDSNTMQTRIIHGDKTYKTSYTFSSPGKIHRIDTIIEQ
ncbi:unnamed protein product [Rotaria magnacalcarata]|nr:unnamed protein product [Rotaria magnacalcarata]CAF1587532.1 unnamed protein product [Rotaria magnacalcarata]CAF2063557.1 unnamed protein product [Rotaria magnacalcarata]CAF2080268.1 unnamed protein product [Rotaria magnacalcarata]CAF2198489.1 unnamed protein product [Rotaria magnacalcarata]